MNSIVDKLNNKYVIAAIVALFLLSTGRTVLRMIQS